MKMYQNLEELRKDFPKIADELAEEFDGGEWTGQPIYLYDDRSDFARHEIENGAYTGFVLNSSPEEYGLPNPLDYIDYSALGDALAFAWDESLHLDTEDGHVAEITL